MVDPNDIPTKFTLKDIGLEAMFLLNLDRRPDRLKHAAQQFESIRLDGVKRWPAVDANALGLKSMIDGISPGMVGCYKSHRDIMKHCLDNNINSYIVFEDDLMFIPRFNDFVELAFSVVPPDWEFIYLGCTEHKNGQPQKFINEFWVVPNSVWGTQCFMIRGRSAIQKIYDALDQMQMQIDCQLSQIVLRGNGIKYYSIYPITVGQLYELESDIQEREQKIT